MKNRFIIIGPGQKNNVLNHSFTEVIDGTIENAIFLDPYIFKNSIVEKIYDIVYRERNRAYFKWLSNAIWNRYSVLRQISLEAYDEMIYIIFVIGRDVDRLIVPSLLKEVKKKYEKKICTVLLLFDSIDVTKEINGWNKIKDNFYLFDIVATFDKNDAYKYGLLHFYDPYPQIQLEEDLPVDIDLFFIGVDKGRCDILKQIARKATLLNLKCDFEIFGLQRENEEVPGLIRLSKFLKYKDALKKVVRSKCLIELLADGQASSSYRYYEAVVYNKKLITNNENIKEMPLYNEKYMKIFKSVDDIDWDWIKADVNVDYNYNGEFSIIKLFNLLEEYYQGERECFRQ